MTNDENSLEAGPIWDKLDPWPYFLRIERDISEVSEFIRFDVENENAFGDRLAEIIIVIGSEIDTNLRLMSGGNGRSTMSDWRRWLTCWNPLIEEYSVGCAFFRSVGYNPFDGLGGDSAFEWWKNYNAIKHNRYQNAYLANITTLNQSACALFAINSYLTYRFKDIYQGCYQCRTFYHDSIPEVEIIQYTNNFTRVRETYYGDIYEWESIAPPSKKYFNLELPCL